MVEIDGSFLEGGGQILRTATALCAATGRSCHVFNIRKNRSKPGLATQHLLGLQALTDLCRGTLEGGSQGSTDIMFRPGHMRGGGLTVRIPTAGSISLVLHVLFLPALLSPKPVHVTFEGGATDTHFAPTIDHFRFVFLEMIRRMGPRATVEIGRRGFYPKGGARVTATIDPCPVLTPLTATSRGALKRIVVTSGAGQALKMRRVAERQAEAALAVLMENLPAAIDRRVVTTEIAYDDTLNPGTRIDIRAEFGQTVIGADGLGRLGKRAEDVGRDAAWLFLHDLAGGGGEACLDRFTADQVLPYLALSGRECRVSVSTITDHAKTNMWVIEQIMTGKFEIAGNLITWKQG